MSFRLACYRCNERWGAEAPLYRCPKCEGRLSFEYSAASSDVPADGGRMWEYRALLPVMHPERAVTLGEGGTPFLPAPKLAGWLGVDRLFLKDETRNPTGTYKDRPASLAVTRALELNAPGIVVASDGNTGPATAAYSARAGLRCVLLMPGATPPFRYRQAQAFGASVALVSGTVNDCIDRAAEIAEAAGYHHTTTATIHNPYQMEAAKTIAWEMVSAWDGEAPDWVAVPVGGGGLLAGIWRGFREAMDLGRIRKAPRLLAVQAEGCAPLVTAFRDGTAISVWGAPSTVALTIGVPYPLDGDLVLQALEESDGSAVAVTDSSLTLVTRRLAELEGVLAEPTGAASVAGVLEARRQGLVEETAAVIAVITGTGMKTIELFGADGALKALPNRREAILEWLEAIR
ncbi:threonine synthase [Limnochorda pilosa]|uniref:Threonine synthase n=1 Tax=Limnochorda pilosa TaxID=1555112 RepID=A0A0K2SL61_LIMPI|nr:threonine synthase [Limnochorda pilosa]BAS27853.1 hypothetical protein LIP_2012 [Limnochorda pilosa]